MKTVYIETSVPSYLTARPSRDLRVAAWQQATADWWEAARRQYDLFTSELVLAEASDGDPAAAQRRSAALADLPLLSLTAEVRDLADLLVEGGGVPRDAEADAIHIAFASVHRMDYLLTWNFRHIDNAATKPRIRAICLGAGFRCPEICTPLELGGPERPDESR